MDTDFLVQEDRNHGLRRLLLGDMAGTNPTRKGMLGPKPVKSLVQKSNALVIIVLMFLLELIVTTWFFMTQICPRLPASYKT